MFIGDVNVLYTASHKNNALHMMIAVSYTHLTLPTILRV